MDDREARNAAIAALLADCAPIIRATIRRKLPEAPLEDLESDIRIALLTRLHAEPVDDLRAYAAVTAYRVCYSWLRENKPNLTSLRNRIRYLLDNDPRFAGRCSDDGAAPDPALAALAGAPLPELLQRIFERTKGPLNLSALVQLVAGIQGIRDAPLRDTAGLEIVTEPGISEAMIDRRRYLQTLWLEVAQLPVAQRRALLLNLRAPDGESLIEAFPACGIASIRQLAATLEIEPLAFAGLWKDLPLDDRAIAERLGVTRQQVINLRKSARERLTRKLRSGWPGLLISFAILRLLTMECLQ